MGSSPLGADFTTLPSIAAHGVTSGSGSSFLAPSIAVAGGDALVVFVAIRSSIDLTAVSDSSGDPFTELAYQARTDGSNHEGLSIWTASDVLGGASVNVTGTFGTTARAVLLVVAVSGVGATPLDARSVFALGTGATASTTLATNASDLVLMAVAVEGATSLTASGGDQLVDIGVYPTGAKDAGADFQASSGAGGNVTLSSTLATSFPWIADSVAFRGVPTAPPTTYPVTFSEAGLASGVNWSVQLASDPGTATTPSSVTFVEPNGSFAFTVTSVPGYDAYPAQGTVTVNGTSLGVLIAFRPYFPLSFAETNLSAGVPWSVTLNGTPQARIAPTGLRFNETNGTYNYTVGAVSGYSANPSTGTVTVNGTAVIVNVTFTPVRPPPTYLVSVSESGLPSGVRWGVVVTGLSLSNVTPGPVLFLEPNGTYNFTVRTVPGFSATPSSGQILLQGSGVATVIAFVGVVPVYATNFTESGLPTGTLWNVTFNGSAAEAVAPAPLSFSVPAGNYSFLAGGVAGYQVGPRTGNVSVVGGPVQVALGYSLMFRAGGAHIQHVVVITLENAEISTVLSEGPYLSYLQGAYGNVSHFYAACHYSLANYLAATSGRTYGCVNQHPHAASNIADSLEAGGFTWAGYFESMPAPCYLQNSGLYARDHNPFVYYDDVVDNASRCDSHVVNSAAFNASLANGTLPNFSYYVPNLDNDGHNTNVSFADRWLSGFLGSILNSTNPQVRSTVNHTAFFVLFDEGTTNLGYASGGLVNSWCHNATRTNLSTCGGQTYLGVVSPYSSGLALSTPTSPYNLLSTIEWLFDLPGDGGWDGLAAFPPMTSLFSFASNGYP